MPKGIRTARGGLINYVGREINGWVITAEVEKNCFNQRRHEAQCVTCGNTLFTSTLHLLSVCKRCHRKPQGYQGRVTLYREYQYNAKRIGRQFSLTLDEFFGITSAPCHYCGREPFTVFDRGGVTDWGRCLFTGIDRMDNAEGYTAANSLPCCFDCNRAKGPTEYAYFMAYLQVLRSFNPPSMP